MHHSCETCHRALLSDALSLVIKAQRNGAFIYFESSSGPEGLQRPAPHAFPLDAEDAKVLRFINAVLSPTRLVLRRHDADLNQVDALREHPLERVSGDLAGQVVPVAFTHPAVGHPYRVGGGARNLDPVGDHLGAEGGVEAVRAIDGDLSHSGMDAPCDKKSNELNGSAVLTGFADLVKATLGGPPPPPGFADLVKATLGGPPPPPGFADLVEATLGGPPPPPLSQAIVDWFKRVAGWGAS